MPISKFAGPLLMAVSSALALMAGPSAYAHTSVKNPAVEGKTEDNAIRIGHGCGHGDHAKPVIAQSVLFPTIAPELSASDGITIGDLSEVIEQGSVAGLMRSIQDRSIFLSQKEKLDSNGNRIGFVGTHGSLNSTLLGRVPFQFTAPNFVSDTCVTRLLVKLAIAEICSRDKPTVREGKLNLWIPDNGSNYANQAKQFAVDGVGEPPTLIVNRDLLANPLPDACRGGIDVTVTPSAADVDGNLSIPGYWQ